MENLIEEEDGNAEFDLVVHPEKQPSLKSPVSSVQSGRARKLTYQEEPMRGADNLLKASYNPFAIDHAKDNDSENEEQEEDDLILVTDPTSPTNDRALLASSRQLFGFTDPLPAHDADSVDEDVDRVVLMLSTLESLKGEIAQRRQ
jgi:hypothetical protein